MDSKVIKVIYMGSGEVVTFSVDKDTTFNIPSSQMYNLEHWLDTEANSIMVTCSNGNKIGLNKYNVQYAEILAD